MNSSPTRPALAGLLAAAIASPLAAGPAITIYNQDLAVVRETVPLTLAAGVSTVTFAGMTSQANANSVILRDPTGRVPFSILEQAYRNDPASQERLLQHFEGSEIGFLLHLDDSQVVQRGRIVRAGGRGMEPLIESDGALRFGLPGIPLFPALQDDAILRPTLVWQIRSPAEATVDAELAYMTGGFSWGADYNIVLPEKGSTASLMGWVTLSNHSGRAFEDTAIKLIAGDVRVNPRGGDFYPPTPSAQRAVMAMAMDAEKVEARAFDEFHLYQLPRTVTLRDQETKQVEFTRADTVAVPEEYIFSMNTAKARPVSPGEPPEFNVAVFRRIENTEANRLGIALPAGNVRFYRRDRDGRLEFVGEDRIPHTPRDETVRVQLGHAFDLLGSREETEARSLPGLRSRTYTVEIHLRNRKDADVEIRVLEPVYQSNTTIDASTLPVARQNSTEVEWRVKVPAGGETKLSYTATARW